MSEKRFRWLKLKEDFFDQKYIRALRKLPQGDSLTIVYLKMQLLSLKTEGILKYEGILPNCISELALALDEDENVVNLAVNALVSFGTIEKWEDGSLYMMAMQDLIGSESASAERVRKHRALRDKVKALQCNADVTGCNEDVTLEKEIEIEIEKEAEVDNISPQAEPEKSQPCPFAKIKDAYHRICVSFPKIRTIDGKRQKAVAARWRTYKSLDVFEELFEIAEASSFLKGNSNSDWSADFDWMMNATNFSKILEHKYDDRDNKGGQNGANRQNNGDDYAGTIWGGQ